MLILTNPEGAPVSFPASAVAEVRPGAFSDLGGGSRVFLATGRIVPVREDADSIEAMLAEAVLSDFDRPDAPRDPVTLLRP